MNIIYMYGDHRLRNEYKMIFAATNTTQAGIKLRPEKNSGQYGIWTHDLCDTSAMLYQMS